MSYVLECARSLSSGTIATLTGDCRYTTIDRIQNDFVAFVAKEEETGEQFFQTWQEAWKVFDMIEKHCAASKGWKLWKSTEPQKSNP